MPPAFRYKKRGGSARRLRICRCKATYPNFYGYAVKPRSPWRLRSKDSILPIRFFTDHKRKGATGFFGKLRIRFSPSMRLGGSCPRSYSAGSMVWFTFYTFYKLLWLFACDCACSFGFSTHLYKALFLRYVLLPSWSLLS